MLLCCASRAARPPPPLAAAASSLLSCTARPASARCAPQSHNRRWLASAASASRPLPPRLLIPPSPPVIAPSADSVADVEALVRRMYSDEMWRRITTTSATEGSEHTGPAAPAASTAAARHPLLHVSLLHRCIHSPDDLCTLQVSASASLVPRHPADRFALALSRGLAHTVLYTARVLRDEPTLTCTMESYQRGLAALRRQSGLPPLPSLAILTRGSVSPAEAIDFSHPAFDYAPAEDQAVTVCFARAEYGRWVCEMVGEGAVVHSKAGDGSFSVPLGDLVRATSSTVRVPVHPHKLIAFRPMEGMSFAQVCAKIQEELAVSDAMATSPRSPFARCISIEAGPQSTRSLVRPWPYSAGTPPPVQTLLLSVWSGPLPPAHYRQSLIFPPDQAGENEPHNPERPKATFRQSEIDHHYELRSEFHSEAWPHWSFRWYERRKQR